MRRLKTLLVGATIISSLILAGGTSRADDSAPPTPTITPVVTGLNNPRGLAVDAKGSLYVSDAGPFLGTGSGVQKGLSTGHVTKWTSPGTRQQRRAWSTPFDSLYTNERGIPEVIGPSGVSAFGNGCMTNSRGLRNGCEVVTIVGESKRGFEAESGGAAAPPQIGHLFKLNPGNGAATDASDVGDQMYQWTGDNKTLYETDFPDSNPYGVLVNRDRRTGVRRTFVADAGANTVSEIKADGTANVLAYIPNDGVTDSTPTCVAQGPDGALYVGTLDLVKNGFGQAPGHSEVWRIDPDAMEDMIGAAHLWATGLTTVTACAFDREGNFWATEMFEPNGENEPPGDVVRIPFEDPTTMQRVGGGQLPFPGGIAPGPGGSMYVSVNSLTFVPDTGAVVKLLFH